MFNSLCSAVAKARRDGDLYFAALLDRQSITETFGEASSLWQGWIYTPAVTIWVFLSQVLSPDHSCREAVTRLLAWRTRQGLAPCSSDTGAYCTARDALPEEACRELVRGTGRQVEDAAAPEWLWHGRRVRVVDGSTLMMPDTPENQAEYPQATSQKPGCGFPIARILVIFSLSVGTVLEAAIGKYQGKETGETGLFRSLAHVLDAGDVVLADRCFAGWFDMALLIQHNVELVIRKHAQRATDFRTGRRLSRGDHVVCLPKPPRPDWMSQECYAALPDMLELREVRVRVTQRGFRTKTLVVVTTLTDAEEFSASEIASLYRRRWQAELHLRNLKVTLQMDHLRCKTPHRVRNEFYMHLLAYNLLRRIMAIAALEAELPPWQISFKGTVQALASFLPQLTSGTSTEASCQALVQCIASHIVGNRPNRFEPRRIKRRPKPHALLLQPRHEYKRLAA